MEKLTFNKLLTWNDILSLGDPRGDTSVYLDKNFFECCCNRNYDIKRFNDNVLKYVYDDFNNQFSDFPFNLENYDFRISYIKDDNGVWHFKFSKVYFVLWLLELANGDNFNSQQKDRIIAKLIGSGSNFYDNVKQLLTEYKLSCSDSIRKISEALDKTSNNILVYDNTRSMHSDLMARRKKINWCISHLTELLSYFENDINLELLDSVDKDKFLLNMSGVSLSKSMIFELFQSKITVEQFENCILNDNRICSYINYLNNYQLMVEYLNSENEDKYDLTVSWSLENNKFIFTTENIFRYFNKLEYYMKDSDIYNNRKDKYNSYSDLLATKANKTWTKIQNDKMIKNIKLNWEMIPTGEKISLSNYKKQVNTKISTNSEKKQAELKHAYDLVEEKMDYFASTKPLFELSGIETFTGYSAYMYSNGVVVFEKFFKGIKKKDKEMLVPVNGEAIYVMNYRGFADLSKYSKMELIQEISDYNNPDIKRILHTSNGSWKERVNKAITGPGYGNLDLEMVNSLSEELSGKKKVLK